MAPREPSRGLKHADSVSGCSLKSHDSVRVIGAHPLGTLRVCNDPIPGPSSSYLLSGDAIVLLDIPAGFVIGYDTVSFTNRGGFRGIKDVPPGPHIIWVSGNETAGARYGYWIWVTKTRPAHKGTVHVKQWDAYNEVLGDPASHAEATFQQDLAAGGQDGDLMMPYTQDGNTATRTASPAGQEEGGGQSSVHMPAFITECSPAAVWIEMVSDITPALLTRVIGKGDGEWNVSTFDTVRGEFELSQERNLYSSISSSPLNFLFSQHTKTFDQGTTGRERTEQALDSTAHILSFLAPSSSKPKLELLRQQSSRTSENNHKAYTDSDVVGEFQFVFLTGLLLGNASCSDQWWYIVSYLIFRAYALPIIHPSLARSLIRTFLAQLVYMRRCVEEGNLWDTPTNPRFSQAKLQKVLATYRKRLSEQLSELGKDGKGAGVGAGASPQQLDVRLAFDQLECWLVRNEGWDLSGQYVREGMVMLEDGEEVSLRLKDEEADAEADQGEFAPVVVEMDEQGREVGIFRWD